MKRFALTRVLMAGLLSSLFTLQSAAAFAANATPRPALSDSDENAVMGWIANRVAAKEQPFCYRESYGRGVGTPLSTCPAGQEKNGLICYPDCKATYGGVGPVCWQGCPSGYVDTGALCHIDKSLTTGGSWVCTKKKWGVCWWKSHECPSGYTNAGAFCALNAPSVPAGYKGLSGLDIEKNSYGRGAGTPMDCKAGQQEDAGLCYTPCHDGYHGVGPVCWQNCPSADTACGVGCANTKSACASDTSSMIIAPVAMVGMIAADVFTGGAAGEGVAAGKTAVVGTEKSAEAAQAAEAAVKAENDASSAYTLAKAAKAISALYKQYQAEIKIAQNAEKIASVTAKMAELTDQWVKNATSNFAGLSTPEVNATLNSQFAGHAAAKQWVEDQYARKNLQMMMSTDLGASAQAALALGSAVATSTSLDPTGVSSVVAAYANPRCAISIPFPKVNILY